MSRSDDDDLFELIGTLLALGAEGRDDLELDDDLERDDEDQEFCRDRANRCLEIISELEASLRRYDLESREMLQRWERDQLHAQWCEDNEGGPE
jgi:hypothetical protein